MLTTYSTHTPRTGLQRPYLVFKWILDTRAVEVIGVGKIRALKRQIAILKIFKKQKEVCVNANSKL